MLAPSDEVWFPANAVHFVESGSTSSAFLVESTQLLNRKELERVLYIQMERLDESYPTV